MNYQKKLWVKRSAVALFLFIAAYFSARGYYLLTDDFRLSNITYDLPFHASWQTAPLTKEKNDRMLSHLSQPFYYLGKGAQSYAFLSADKEYVVKFFKFKHLKPSLAVEALPDISPFSAYKKKKSERKKRLVNSVFSGYKLAFDLHKEETGLVFVHLNKSSDLKKTLVLYDKIGRRVELDLDSTVFVLQKTVVQTREVVAKALSSGDIDLVNKRMDQIIQLYRIEYQKGIYDRDHGLMRNTGFIGDRPIHLDVGKLAKDERIKEQEYYIRDLLALRQRFDSWLERNYPQYRENIISHFEKTADLHVKNVSFRKD